MSSNLDQGSAWESYLSFDDLPEFDHQVFSFDAFHPFQGLESQDENSLALQGRADHSNASILAVDWLPTSPESFPSESSEGLQEVCAEEEVSLAEPFDNLYNFNLASQPYFHNFVPELDHSTDMELHCPMLAPLHETTQSLAADDTEQQQSSASIPKPTLQSPRNLTWRAHHGHQTAYRRMVATTEDLRFVAHHPHPLLLQPIYRFLVMQGKRLQSRNWSLAHLSSLSLQQDRVHSNSQTTSVQFLRSRSQTLQE